MQKRVAAMALVLALLAFGASPVFAITFGQPDGNLHPNVGALVVEFNPGVKELLCSGTLIAPTVFLTASHCTAYLASIGIGPDQVWVTFDPTPDANSEYISGTYHTNPAYGTGGQSDTHDIAVVVLDDEPAGITPATLPPANYLDTLKVDGTLKSALFTAVGYGADRTTKTGGPHAIQYHGERLYVTQSFLSLTNSWLHLSENISTGSGGTCYGDSGGPHFFGDTTMVVAITVTGDTVCRATDVDYRLDTASARSFLSQFVTLP